MSDKPHRNGDEELTRLRNQFEQLPQAEPSIELDQKILAMAQTALHERQPARTTGLLKEHASLITAAAAAVFAIGIVFTLADPTREAPPTSLPAPAPMQIEVIESAATEAQRERRSNPKMPPAKTAAPARPQMENVEPDRLILEDTLEGRSEPLDDLSTSPGPKLVAPEPPRIADPRQADEALGQSVFLPLPEAAAGLPEAPPEAERLRKRQFAPDPGSSSARSANESDLNLEMISVEATDLEAETKPARQSADEVLRAQSGADWALLVGQARAARRAGDEAEVTRLVAYLTEHFPERELPADLRPDPQNADRPQ